MKTAAVSRQAGAQKAGGRHVSAREGRNEEKDGGNAAAYAQPVQNCHRGSRDALVDVQALLHELVCLVAAQRHAAGDLIVAAHAAGAWWLGLWQQADIVVFNVGHHFLNIDGSFRKLAAEGANSLAKHSKPGARIIFRTSNVGHFKLR